MRLFLMVLMLALVAACASPAASPTPAPGVGGEDAAPTSGTAAPATPVTLALGYIPNVQFAPFYVAIHKGYFAAEGVEVTLDYGMEDDIVQLVGTDQLQFAAASGDQILLARSKGLPVVYVATWYKKYPIAVASTTLNLRDPKALEGHKVGLPGLFGANYVGWLALAQAAGIDAETVTLEAVGFNQVPVLTEGRVDAIVGYVNNEPLQLQRLAGDVVSVARVSDYVSLVANGLITNEKTIKERPELVQAVVRGFLRGMSDTLSNPDEAFDITVSHFVPEAGGDNAATQRQVLMETLDLWRNEPLGDTSPADWESSHDFLREAGLLDQDVPLSAAYTNQFADAFEE